MSYLKRSILALRTLFFVLMASLVVFVATTSLGALHERDKILALAHDGARQAVEQNLPAISVALWNYDNSSLEALLRGLTRSGTLSRLEVLDRKAVVADIGRLAKSEVPDRVWSLEILSPAGDKSIGSIRVSESHAEVHELTRSALRTLIVTELIKIVGLTSLLFVIVYRQIARHLNDMARDVAALDPLDPNAALALRRRTGKRPDELDTLVAAINRSHRERAEEMQKRSSAELSLRERMAEIEAVLGSLSDGVIALDRECRVRHANGAAQALLAVPGGIGQGMALETILAIVSAGGDITQGLCRTALMDGLPVQLRGDVLIRTRDGRAFDAKVSVMPVPEGGEAALILVFTDISAEIGKERRIEFQAFHDPLTELGNRSLLARDLGREIGQAALEGSRIALLCLDLDNFKNINDALGHAVGDILLQQLAQRLRQAVPEPGWTTRHGGDEFIVVLPQVAHESEAVVLAETVMAAIAEPFHIEGNELRITSSVGISLYPDHGLTQGELISNADMAMFEAKRSGRNACCFYESEQLQRSSDRLSMENGLRVALLEGEFSLAFQPKVRLAGRRADAVEALLRWNSRRRGAVSPATFIPIAEETGLIIEIGEWVLRESLAAALRLRAALGREVAVAVNVSPIQFRSERLSQTLRELSLREPDLPKLLEIELTEQALAGDISEVTGKLREIKALGLKIAIDDFGTGYSSLAYLKNFPVDILKIDQAFIRGLHINAQDRSIVGSVVRLGKSLGFEIVAEGVEEEAHVHILEELACDYAQGYWFARPLPEAALVERLQELAGEPSINPA